MGSADFVSSAWDYAERECKPQALKKNVCTKACQLGSSISIVGCVYGSSGHCFCWFVGSYHSSQGMVWFGQYSPTSILIYTNGIAPWWKGVRTTAFALSEHS